MAINDIVQTIAEARVDARSLSEFVFKPAGFKVARRLAPPIDTLQFYIDRFDATKATTDAYIATIPSIVNDAINNTAIEGGVLADTFVTVTASGVGTVARTQRSKNNDSLTPYDFGAIGDGVNHPLSERYATLSAAQEVYPHATALTDSIDWCAIQAFFNYCHANHVISANTTCLAYINKPLEYKGYEEEHATSIFYGDLELNTDQDLEYILWLSGQRIQHLGRIKLSGKGVGTPKELTTKVGLMLGDLTVGGGSGAMTNAHINYVEVYNVSDCAVHWGNLCHFSSIGQVRGSRIGAGIVGNSYLSHPANITAVSNVAGDTGQRSTLTVDSLPPTQITETPRFCTVDGQLYSITDINRVNSTIDTYPLLPNGVNTGTLSYHYGAVVRTTGNDTSNLRIGTLQAIQCGIAVCMQALYGLYVTTLVTEFCGVAATIGSRGSISIGNKIGTGYFEGNVWDVAYAWNSGNNILPIATTVALDPAKIISLFSFRGGSGELADGVYATAGYGDVTIGGATYNSKRALVDGELSNPEQVQAIFRGSEIIVSLDDAKERLFSKKSTTYVLLPTIYTHFWGDQIFTAEEGSSINGAASVTVHGEDYAGAIIVTVAKINEVSYRLSIVGNKVVKKGSTDSRPLTPMLGDKYYDTTLLDTGKPISWNGSAWVDASGAAV